MCCVQFTNPTFNFTLNIDSEDVSELRQMLMDFSDAEAMRARAEAATLRAANAPERERGPACLECGSDVALIEAAPGMKLDCPACGEIIGAKLLLQPE